MVQACQASKERNDTAGCARWRECERVEKNQALPASGVCTFSSSARPPQHNNNLLAARTVHSPQLPPHRAANTARGAARFRGQCMYACMHATGTSARPGMLACSSTAGQAKAQQRARPCRPATQPPRGRRKQPVTSTKPKKENQWRWRVDQRRRRHQRPATLLPSRQPPAPSFHHSPDRAAPMPHHAPTACMLPIDALRGGAPAQDTARLSPCRAPGRRPVIFPPGSSGRNRPRARRPPASPYALRGVHRGPRPRAAVAEPPRVGCKAAELRAGASARQGAGPSLTSAPRRPAPPPAALAPPRGPARASPRRCAPAADAPAAAHRAERRRRRRRA